MPVKTPVKFYWTKKRKQKRLMNIFFASLVGTMSLIIIGLSLYTNHYILKMGVVEIAYAKEIVSEPEPEPIRDMILRISEEEGFQWPDYLLRLANCESRLDPYAVNEHNNKPSNSRDRGLFQINSYFHYEITDEQAFDPEFSIRWTMDMINAGRQHEWACDPLIRANPDKYR